MVSIGTMPNHISNSLSQAKGETCESGSPILTEQGNKDFDKGHKDKMDFSYSPKEVYVQISEKDANNNVIVDVVGGFKERSIWNTKSMIKIKFSLFLILLQKIK